MILTCNFEELRALDAGADLILDPLGVHTSASVVAPVKGAAQVAMLQPRLTGSLTIETLDEQSWMVQAVEAICTTLHERMDEKVLEFHPAHEEAVALYFDYAHAFGVLRRLEVLGSEMRAVIELMTGEQPTTDSAKKVSFPE